MNSALRPPVSATGQSPIAPSMPAHGTSCELLVQLAPEGVVTGGSVSGRADLLGELVAARHRHPSVRPLFAGLAHHNDPSCLGRRWSSSGLLHASSTPARRLAAVLAHLVAGTAEDLAQPQQERGDRDDPYHGLPHDSPLAPGAARSSSPAASGLR